MKFTTSPIIGSLSGSSGDVTAASWKGRGYVRRRVVPANPQSNKQTRQRNGFTRTNACYQALSAGIKAFLDLLGQTMQISGFNRYGKANCLAEAIDGLHAIMPANSLAQSVTSLAAEAGSVAGTIDVTWDPSGWTDADDPQIFVRLQTAVADDTDPLCVFPPEHATPWTVATIAPAATMDQGACILTGLEAGELYAIAVFGKIADGSYGGGQAVIATAKTT